MTNVLVTGGRGFVGRALLPELLRQDTHVKAITRSKTAQPNDPVHWITLQIRPDTDWTEALKDVDCVIHLADGLRAFEKTEQKPKPDGSYLIDATLNLAKAAADAKVKRFIYVSSIKAAAGETSDRTLDETLEPEPATAYGYMKLECEKALNELLAPLPIELTIIRNPIVYGPGATNNMARLLKIADTSYPMPFKALENRRSIISAQNLASALATVADFKGSGDGVFYVHDGDRLSTGEIINIFRAELGRRQTELGIPEWGWELAKKLPVIGATARRLAGTLLINDVKFRGHFQWLPVETSEEALTKMAQAYKSDTDNQKI